MIASSIVGALEKLVLIADYYDQTLRMTCEVQDISTQVRTILVTVDKAAGEVSARSNSNADGA